jgi:hypothetical protein
MKALSYAISMTATVAASLLAPASPGLARDASTCAAGGEASGYPTFCAIPQPPHDVRTPGQFKAAVVATRSAGRAMVRSSQAGGWSLSEGDAAAFLAKARAEATPPPPMTSPDDEGPAAFSRAARAAATPPPRPH